MKLTPGDHKEEFNLILGFSWLLKMCGKKIVLVR